MRLLNALFGVVERLLYGTEDAAITESDPNSMEADMAIKAARREEFRAAALVEGPGSNLLETLETRIVRTGLTLQHHVAAMLGDRGEAAGALLENAEPADYRRQAHRHFTYVGLSVV